jgi:protein kinase-like protein/FG-GAP repeat protein/VCBS repeat protein
MEPVRGRTLEERLRHEGPLGAREAALLGAELCGALAAVHAAGLVHGDVKTHNIMREGAPGHASDAGRIVLMDFGSSHESTAPGHGPPGTPLFTAPEVLAGGRATPGSDLWSLGVVLYRLVSGRWPVEAATSDELRARMSDPGPIPLRAVRSELPAKFVSAVERALERDPARRWNDAAAFERELLSVLGAEGGVAEWTRRHHAQKRRRRLAGAGVAIVAASALAWLGVTQGERAWMQWRMRGAPLVVTLAAERMGPTANAALGSYVYNIGDLNGDGRDDIVASAEGAYEHGEAYVFTPAADSTLTPWLTLKAEHPNDGFGTVTAGDFNGDGHRDLAVSAVFNDAGGRDAGRVYVYFGPHRSGKPDVIIDGTQPAQYFGWGLGAGDLNGDHIDDLIVGAPYDSRGLHRSGRAWVYLGGPHFGTKPDLDVSCGVEDSGFGVACAFLGDVNGDGFGDFAVSAPSYSGGGPGRGAAFLYFGGRQLHDRPDFVLKGEHDHEGFGLIRQQTGDLNGDGYPDIAVASETGHGLETGSGLVRVYFGGPDVDAKPDLLLKGEHRGDGFGKWADGSRDVDGDGIADLLVTAPWADVPAGAGGGRVYLYLGGREMDDVPDAVLDGPAASAVFGWGGCLVPDRGHGIGSLLIGVKNWSQALTQSGGVQLFDLARWNIREPGPRDGWVPGGRATLHWTGSTRADVSLSADGGHAWRVVRRGAGGGRVNGCVVPLPADVRGPVRVRLSAGSNQLEREFALGAR